MGIKIAIFLNSKLIIKMLNIQPKTNVQPTQNAKISEVVPEKTSTIDDNLSLLSQNKVGVEKCGNEYLLTCNICNKSSYQKKDCSQVLPCKHIYLQMPYSEHKKTFP